MGRRRQREQEAMITQTTDSQVDENKVWQEQQRAILERQKQQYREFQFTNPFAGMENPFEDLTVDQQSAQFQMEQGRQQRANILASLSGAAGASGIAGLAQTLAGQGTLQARQVGADISRQEAANRMATAQGAQQIETLRRQGAAAVQQAEAAREATLYASELGEMAGARAGMQAAFANQMSGQATMASMQNARMGMWGDIIGGVTGAIGDVAELFTKSDRKLKKNIKLVSKSPSGLPIYTFEYIDAKFGEGVYQGVMSDEVPLEAVVKHPDGYDMVDYGMIDVEFKKLN